MTTEQQHSVELTRAMDNKIVEAIRKAYQSSEEADILIDHFYNTLDDAESYFNSNCESREHTMYSGDFAYRLEYIEEPKQ